MIIIVIIIIVIIINNNNSNNNNYNNHIYMEQKSNNIHTHSSKQHPGGYPTVEIAFCNHGTSGPTPSVVPQCCKSP